MGRPGQRRWQPWRLVPSVAIVALAMTTSAVASGRPVVPRPTTVRIDPRGLGLRLYRELGGRRLEQALMVRLIREGFAVASWAAGGDVRLRLRESALGLRLEAKGPAGVRTREVRLHPEPLPGLYLELAQKSVQLVHAALRTSPEPPPTAGDKPRAPSESSPSPAARPPVALAAVTSVPARATRAKPPGDHPTLAARAPLTEHRVTWTAGAGIVLRAGGADTLVRTDLHARMWRGLTLTLNVGFVPADSTMVETLEWQILGGLTWRHWLLPSLAVRAGVLVGVLGHRLEQSVGTPLVRRYDPLFTVPVSLEWRFHRWLGLNLQFALGATTQGRSYATWDGSAVQWSRGAVRAELSAGLTLHVP